LLSYKWENAHLLNNTKERQWIFSGQALMAIAESHN